MIPHSTCWEGTATVAHTVGADKTKDKRDLIREAAIRVIAEEGFYQATTDRIAQEAGVAVGTIYNYFRNKEDILADIFRTTLERRIGWFSELVGSELTTYEKLQLFLERHATELTAEPALARILVRERSFARKQDPGALQDYLHQIPAALQHVLQEGQRRGEVTTEIDPEVAALALMGALEAVTRVSVESGGTLALDRATWALLDSVWYGLAPMSSPHPIERPQ